MMIKHNKAQSLIEYGLVLGVVTIALLSMQVYFKRGVQSVFKVAADDYGPQGEAVNNVEVAVKKKIYGQVKDGGLGKLIVNSKGSSNSVVAKKNLMGDGSIRTETASSNTASGDEAGVSISADYKDRKID